MNKMILSTGEQETLKKLERVIKRGVSTFLEVGSALLRIRNERLYRAKYDTFDDYCRKKWGFQSSRARQLIGAAQVIENVKSVTSGNTSTGGKEVTLPESERQTRELAGLSPEQQKDAWDRAVKTAPKGKVTGKHLKNARRSADSNGSPAVSFFLNSEGADLFSRATEQHVGDKLAIVLDNVASSAPVINERIGAEGIINGRFTIQQAEDLALLLRSGALPASLRVLEERSVGASLGNDAIRAGIMASLIGFGMVVLIMVVYYKHAGVNAIYCLMANLIILMGFMGALGATLTLPGIAGVILTIGMATDSNILIFERIREELRTGKTIRAAIDTSFKRVFWTIVDTHLCTLIAAAFLFQFGTWPIRGFAVTLTVGLIANMFTAVYFSHRLFDLMLGGKKLEKLSI